MCTSSSPFRSPASVGSALGFALYLVAAETRAEPSEIARQISEEPAPNLAVPLWHGGALLGAMRVGAAVLWPDPFADFTFSSMGQSYTAAYTLPPRWEPDRSAFEWDGDRWPLNVIGHGLFGSELYLKTRVCRHGPWAALALAAGGSVVWEYVVEASAVRPSALDLWYTPLAGAVLGEARFVGSRWARAQNTSAGDVLAVLLDPLGEFERALGSPC